MAILDEANLRLSDFAVEEIIDNVSTKILLAKHSIFRAVFIRFNMYFWSVRHSIKQTRMEMA
jgi:hypothetical protein